MRPVGGKPQSIDAFPSNLLALPDPLPRPNVPQPDPRSLTEIAPDGEGAAVRREVEPSNVALHGQCLEATGMGWIVDGPQYDLPIASARNRLVVGDDTNPVDVGVMLQRMAL